MRKRRKKYSGKEKNIRKKRKTRDGTDDRNENAAARKLTSVVAKNKFSPFFF